MIGSDENNETGLFLKVIVLPLATKSHHHQFQVYVYTALKSNIEKESTNKKDIRSSSIFKGPQILTFGCELVCFKTLSPNSSQTKIKEHFSLWRDVENIAKGNQPWNVTLPPCWTSYLLLPVPWKEVFYVQAWKRRMSRPSRSVRKKRETGEVGCGRSSKKTYHNLGGGGWWNNKVQEKSKFNACYGLVLSFWNDLSLQKKS